MYFLILHLFQSCIRRKKISTHTHTYIYIYIRASEKKASQKSCMKWQKQRKILFQLTTKLSLYYNNQVELKSM